MLVECILIASSLCHTLRDKPVLALAAAQAAVVGADYAQTEYHATHNFNFQEHNPLLAPLVGHPAALTTDVAAGTLFTAWIAHRMRFSRHAVFRRTWWLPQSLEIASSIWGIASSKVQR